MIRVRCPVCGQTAWWDDEGRPLLCTRCRVEFVVTGGPCEEPADEPTVVVPEESP